jgi:hypothetical protein
MLVCRVGAARPLFWGPVPVPVPVCSENAARPSCAACTTQTDNPLPAPGPPCACSTSTSTSIRHSHHDTSWAFVAQLHVICGTPGLCIRDTIYLHRAPQPPCALNTHNHPAPAARPARTGVMRAIHAASHGTQNTFRTRCVLSQGRTTEIQPIGHVLTFVCSYHVL